LAAAAFTGVLKFVCKDGYQFQQRVTISDVAAAFYIFQDANNILTLPSNHGPVALYDVILVTGGTDTHQATVYCNGIDTGVRIDNNSNLTTVIDRQFKNAPVVFPAGATIRFTQAA
jgi:hypothetical protein